VDFGEGRYSAFFTHVAIWSDKVVGHDVHPNAPGLGRLGEYIRANSDQRVIFRALYEQGLADSSRTSKACGPSSTASTARIRSSRRRTRGCSAHCSRTVPTCPLSASRWEWGRKSRRDAYLPPDLADEVVGLADKAEQFFDALVIRGKSKTQKTAAGNPRTVEVNLLSRRLHVPVDLPRDPANRSAVEQSTAFSALTVGRIGRAHVEKPCKLAS
jgi:hypothetical protein